MNFRTVTLLGRMFRKIFIWLFLLFIILSSVSFAGVIQLPQTGQTKCYDSGGDEIACAGSGQDGELRAGVPWPNPRFTIGTGAEFDCIIDNLTGLMWPRNGNLAGNMDWYSAIDYAKDLTLCGYSDWSLPNVNELESLVNAEEPNSAAWLNTRGFYNAQSDYYWSSTTRAYGSTLALIVHMWYNYVDDYYKDSINFFVWPVRSGQSSTVQLPKTGQTVSYQAGDDGDLEKGVTWPNPRFSVNGNCVTDNLTGLMWTINANLAGSKTWQGALDYSNNLNLCGYSDWRLPNRKELMSLIDRSQYNLALPAEHPFINVRSDGYWSSTTDVGSATYVAWIVDVGDGSVNGDYKDVNGYYYVWSVRSVGMPVESPDLTVTALTFTPSKVIRGNSITVITITKNNGKGSAGESTTRYYLSANNKKDKKDKLLNESNTVQALDVAASSSGSTSVTIPANSKPGSYYIIACADDTKSVTESNEKNNCKISKKKATIKKK